MTLQLLNKQDEPSLESSLYLNLSLRYIGPWNQGTLEPSEIIPHHNSPYILVPSPKDYIWDKTAFQN